MYNQDFVVDLSSLEVCKQGNYLRPQILVRFSSWLIFDILNTYWTLKYVFPGFGIGYYSFCFELRLVLHNPKVKKVCIS